MEPPVVVLCLLRNIASVGFLWTDLMEVLTVSVEQFRHAKALVLGVGTHAGRLAQVSFGLTVYPVQVLVSIRQHLGYCWEQVWV